ncbi:hypothetical protein EJV46_17925 [Roseococcus sp. SYP-B2431]|uniref:hypothetical protein n=1 Tax=Roseococcus sp. SYP-B2431 TaxID=2496640 RepID=UPI001038C6F0|nr:hypothetical protein [Roseococcus sp. SYP-B2431]TCH97190.1 hypothetical protein EJV46_17925 [Roseococcus sp. SYP-B2431]
MTRFRILFAFDALIALFVLQQVLSLLAERYSYPSLMAAELLVLAVCVGSLWGAATLNGQGRFCLASLVLLIPAVPAMLALLGLGLIIFLFSIGGGHH